MVVSIWIISHATIETIPNNFWYFWKVTYYSKNEKKIFQTSFSSYSFLWLPNCANLFSVILILTILDLCFMMKFQIFLIYSLWWNSYISNKRFNHADFSYFLELIYSIKHRETVYLQSFDNFHCKINEFTSRIIQNVPSVCD